MGIVICYGTRPEAVKLGPVANELRNLQVPFRVIQTGQHTHLLKGTPAETDLQPDTILHREDWDQELWVKLACELHSDDIVVIQGDTQTAWEAARAADSMACPLAHVEAGVRSGDLQNPYPEEGYRREISRLADYHFAPTIYCAENLQDEDIHKNVWVTGNPIVSAMHRYATLRVEDAKPYIIVTMHRREFLNDPERVKAVWEAAQIWSDSQLAIKVSWPVHPSLQPLVSETWVRRNFVPSAPWPYTQFQKLLRSAMGVITDSGGLVEEAITLGIPTACLRVVHDRPEAEGTGIFQRFDPTPEGFRLGADFVRTTPGLRIPGKTFGDVGSALRIAKHLRSILKSRPGSRIASGPVGGEESGISPSHTQDTEKHGKTLPPTTGEET